MHAEKRRGNAEKARSSKMTPGSFFSEFLRSSFPSFHLLFRVDLIGLECSSAKRRSLRRMHGRYVHPARLNRVTALRPSIERSRLRQEGCVIRVCFLHFSSFYARHYPSQHTTLPSSINIHQGMLTAIPLHSKAKSDREGRETNRCGTSSTSWYSSKVAIKTY